MVEILQWMLTGRLNKRAKYPKHFRQFCLQLNFLSPRAYKFIRQTMIHHLPHPRTMLLWYKNAESFYCEPGVTKTAVEIIKNFVIQIKSEGEDPLFSISTDEMSIHKGVHYMRDGNIGYYCGGVTYGKQKNQSGEPLIAKQAIVYYLNCINRPFQIPFLFHFIASLNFEERAALLNEAINVVEETGGTVTNVSFDGLASNKKMSEFLGAKLDVEPSQMVTHFKSTLNNDIHIIYDPPHMLKLIRNIFGSKKYTIYDRNGNKIDFELIRILQEESKDNQYISMHKLTQRHVDFERNKMKVSYATQLLSDSVANAIEYLMKCGDERFKNAEPTIYFIRTINAVFDAQNSKYKDAEKNVYKRPISSTNIRIITHLYTVAIEYISSLKIKRTGETKKIPILRSQVRCGFRGFIINMKSILKMYHEYVPRIIPVLPVYNLGTDHLEIFFGKIRSKNGHSDNPTIQQWTAAYRKLVLFQHCPTSTYANCEDNCYREVLSSILTVASTQRTKISMNDFEMPETTHGTVQQLAEIDANKSLLDILDTSNYVYIASIIEQKLQKKIEYCEHCDKVFQENDKVDERLLVSRRMYKPCVSTVRICKIASSVLNSKQNELFYETMNHRYLYNQILVEIGETNLFSKSNFITHPDHKYAFISAITEAYITIHTSRVGAAMKDGIHKEIVRHKLRKLIHNYGQ